MSAPPDVAPLRAPTVLAWARERLASSAAVGAFLLAACLGAAPALAPSEALLRVGFVAVCAALLRLVDDLTDLPHDRIAHPARALSRAVSVGRFALLALLLGLGAGALLFALGGAGPVGVLGALLAALVALTPLSGWPSRGLAQLAKYPVVVTLLTTLEPIATPPVVALAALMTWAAFVAHEVLHDPAMTAWRGLLAPSLGLLALGHGLALLRARGGAATALGALALPVVVALAWAYVRYRRGAAPGAWQRVPFLAALPTLVTGGLA